MKKNRNAKVLITGGPVLPLDGVTPPQEAILLEGDRILGIGTKKEMSSLAGPKAHRIDVAGATVMPGLVDTHPHVMHMTARYIGIVDIRDARCHDDIVDRIRAQAAVTPAGQWIITTPVGEPDYFIRRSYRDLAEGRLPDRSVLDKATDKHPVFIPAWAPRTPNICAFNSAGLAAVGIYSITPDRVCDVWIDKDENGRPTGILRGSVNNYYNFDPFWLQIQSKLPPPPSEIWLEGARKGMAEWNNLGATSVYEGHCMTLEQIEAYKTLRAGNQLTCRVLATLELVNTFTHPEPPDEKELLNMLNLGKSLTDVSDDLLRVNGVTLCICGPCWPGFFRTYEPFKDPYGNETLGRLFAPAWSLGQSIKFCLENDLRLNILQGNYYDHDMFFHAIEPYVGKYDLKERGWIVQHNLLISESQARRYAELGLLYTTSMSFSFGKGDMYGDRIGKHVWKDLIPLRRLLDAGLVVGCGCDWGPRNIFKQIQLAETHEFAGSGHRNLLPGQPVTREEALLMWTRDAASVLGWPGIGTLTPGNFADVIIVDRNPLTCDLDALPDTQVLRTFLSGAVVYDSGAL